MVSHQLIKLGVRGSQCSEPSFVLGEFVENVVMFREHGNDFFGWNPGEFYSGVTVKLEEKHSGIEIVSREANLALVNLEWLKQP